jgi:hypothetical protein
MQHSSNLSFNLKQRLHSLTYHLHCQHRHIDSVKAVKLVRTGHFYVCMYVRTTLRLLSWTVDPLLPRDVLRFKFEKLHGIITLVDIAS